MISVSSILLKNIAAVSTSSTSGMTVSCMNSASSLANSVVEPATNIAVNRAANPAPSNILKSMRPYTRSSLYS